MRKNFLALLLSMPLLLGACASAPKSPPVPLGIETGTWEVSNEILQSRKTLPQEFVDRMKPEERKEYEEMLRKSESFPKVLTSQTCVTAEDLEAGVFNADIRRLQLKCKLVVKVGTATHQEVDRVCEGTRGSRVQHVTLDADSRESVRSKMVTPSADLVIQVTGKWLRASCPE